MVNFLLIDKSFFDGIYQRGKGQSTKIGIDTSLQGHHTCFLTIVRHAMGTKDAINAIEVADNETTEPPLVTKQVGK